MVTKQAYNQLDIPSYCPTNHTVNITSKASFKSTNSIQSVAVTSCNVKSIRQKPSRIPVAVKGLGRLMTCGVRSSMHYALILHLALLLTVLVVAGSGSLIPRPARLRAPSVVYRKTKMWNSSWLRNSIFTHPGVVDDYELEYGDEVEVATANAVPPIPEGVEDDDEDNRDDEDNEYDEEDDIPEEELVRIREAEGAKVLSTVSPSALFRALLNDCCLPVETVSRKEKFPKPGTVKRISEAPGPWPVGRRGSTTWREKRIPEVGPGAAGRCRNVLVWTVVSED